MIKVINTCDYCGKDITADECSTTYRRGNGPKIVIKDVCECCTREMMDLLDFLGINDLQVCFIQGKRKE